MRKDTQKRIERDLQRLLDGSGTEQLVYRGFTYWADAADMVIYGHPSDAVPARGRKMATVNDDLKTITPEPDLDRVIMIATIKGGTGKTTTTAALAQAAAATGKLVLAIDLDPQCNLTAILDAERSSEDAGAYAILHGKPVVDEIQHTSQHSDVIAGSPALAVEQTTSSSSTRLRAALEPVRDCYDLIFIDTPPHMGELVYNALYAADGLIITAEPDIGSLQGLTYTLSVAHRMRDYNKALHVIGTVMTKYNSRTNLSRYLYNELSEKGDELDAPLLGVIRNGVAIKEAQYMQKSLFEYAPKSKPAIDYMELYKTITKEL